MLASDIKIVDEVLIQLPNDDSYQVIRDQFSLQQFVRSYGNVVVELMDTRRNNQYSVPAFAESRKRFSEIKTADCERWGCE